VDPGARSRSAVRGPASRTGRGGDPMSLIELGRRDRLTLRVWRLVNLVGWGVVASVVYNTVVWSLFRTFVQKLAYQNVNHALTWAAILAVLAFAGVTAGWIVGGRVYRSPVVVTISAILFPWGLVTFVAPSVAYQLVPFPSTGVALIWMFTRSPSETLEQGVFILLPLAAAVAMTTIAWRRRPRALRLPR
jgi:hypothetical protein